MTETSSQTATLSAADAIRKIGSAGKPLFFNQIKINEQQTPGENGEVYIRGPHVTPGYIGRFEDKIHLLMAGFRQVILAISMKKVTYILLIDVQI